MGEKKLNLIVFGGWIFLFFLCLSQHTPWRDEYQSWLTAVRPEGFFEFLNAIRYERSPPLHYLLERLFSYLPGVETLDPSTAFRMVTVPFSLAAVYLWIFSLKLPLGIRYTFPFSLVMLREYGIISRSYSLGVFFFFLGCSLKLRGRQNAYLISLLLAGSTHALFTLIAGSLFLLEVWDQRKNLRLVQRKTLVIYLTIAFGFLGLVLFQTAPKDSAFPHAIHPTIGMLKEMVIFLVQGVTMMEMAGRVNLSPWSLENSLSTLVLLILIARTLSFPWQRFLFVIFPPLLVISGAYGFALRHTGTLSIALMVVSILYWNKTAFLKYLTIPAVLSTFGWIFYWNPFLSQPHFDYSGSRELHENITSEFKSNNSVLLVFDRQMFFPISTLARIPLFEVKSDKFAPYPYFNSSEWKYTFSEWCSREKKVRSTELAGKNLFFAKIRTGDSIPTECGCVQEIFSNQRKIATDENYQIFKWFPDRPEGKCR